MNKKEDSSYWIQPETRKDLEEGLKARKDLEEGLEDTLQYFCDKWGISGEVAWAVTECFAASKAADIQFKGKIPSELIK